MESLKIRFWVKLALVVATTYLMTSYVFNPLKNHCQMTFMMEPPRFIPIPLGDNVITASEKGTDYFSDYKLFMYSEFGFPLEADLRRDLRDSMPVLFIPGNAGSYQQVRSLASTCIRSQLQSLDAFKFVFYTINFQAQLSGLSGDLINRQIDFVHAALNQISQQHPTQTNGVIVIGHSVGGFLSKAVFTRPNFDPDLVPLLINLASPLTRPYLNIDDEIKRTYADTNAFWSKNLNKINTVSISISGGPSDRLVPMHTSLDPSYDLSLTTSSIRDVWLTTDHVCITWCRELMYKLASLLSQVMDKKETRLIGDKKEMIRRAYNHLLTPVVQLKRNDLQTRRNIKIARPKSIVEFESTQQISRSELMEDMMILNVTRQKSGDLFIWIEHIDQLKPTGIQSCAELDFSSTPTSLVDCLGQKNLLEFALDIPSRRYEPKKKVISLSFHNNQELNYIILNFSPKSQHKGDSNGNKVPESVSIQVLEATKSSRLYIPTVFEHYFNKLYLSNTIEQILPDPKDTKSIVPITFELDNLVHQSQFYKLTVSSPICVESEAVPRILIVLITQGQYVRETFQPDKGKSFVSVNLNSHKAIMFKNSEMEHAKGGDKYQLGLQMYLDGSCKTTITIDFDWFSFAESLIQGYLCKILSLSCYFAYASMVCNLFKYTPAVNSNYLGNISSWTFWLAGSIIIYCDFMRVSSVQPKYSFSFKTDETVRYLSIFTISQGLVSTIEYFINRIVDLATILNNMQSSIRDKFLNATAEQVGSAHTANGQTENGNTTSENDKTMGQTFNLIDCDWIVFSLALAGSVLLSEALMSSCMLIMLIKLELNLIVASKKLHIESAANNQHVLDKNKKARLNKLNALQELTVSCATICALGLLVNIPVALLMTNKTYKLTDLVWNLSSLEWRFYFIVTLISNIMVIMISKSLDTLADEKDEVLVLAQNTKRITGLSLVYDNLHLCALVPMVFICDDIRLVNVAQLVALVWLAIKTRPRPRHEGDQKVKTE